MEEGTFGPLLHAKFHPHRCNVSPLRGEKPQNRPLSKLNTGSFALRAMLLVIKKPRKGPDGHHRQHAWLVVAYLQSQLQASSFHQRGDKTQWILVISTLFKLRSHVTANWGEIQIPGPENL